MAHRPWIIWSLLAFPPQCVVLSLPFFCLHGRHSLPLHVLSCSVVSDSLQPHGLYPTRLLCPWHSPSKNTGAGFHAFLQGIFPTQGWNPHLLCLLHGRKVLYQLSHRGGPGGCSVIALFSYLTPLPGCSFMAHPLWLLTPGLPEWMPSPQGSLCGPLGLGDPFLGGLTLATTMALIACPCEH